MNWFDRIFPWATVALASIYLAFCALPNSQPAETFDLEDLATFPVKYHGRVQPLDTVARNGLMIISGRQTFVEEFGSGENTAKKSQSAVRWLLDVIAFEGGGKAARHKVFRIENDQVLDLLGLKPRPGSYRYSYAELFPRFDRLDDRLKAIRFKKSHDLFDTKVFELAQHLQVYDELSSNKAILLCPPPEPGEGWTSYKTAQKDVQAGNKDPLQLKEAMLGLVRFYRDGNVSRFNEILAVFQNWFKSAFPKDLNAAEQETFFNRFAPFYHASILYLIVFVLACLSWICRPKTFSQAAFALGILTLLLHSWALFIRMYLSGRPAPVFNLYSSAVFIGWGCSLMGLGLDFVFRNGFGCAIGAVTGAASLIIAHFLSITGDTLGVLEPVLDTNFWLATHVTCITFGYTATFIAGFIGIAYVLTMLVVPQPTRQTVQDFARMMYGVVCFAMLFSFVGTVLGGIWGDQSWGRFWGWDVKENGALLIVLMNALILHARWGGMIKTRGLAVLAIFGNIVTTWSWFGVNMLNVGLHTYGPMDNSALLWMLLFIGSQVFLGVLGMFDPAVVRSFASSVGLFFMGFAGKIVSFLTGSGGDDPGPAATEA